MSVLAPNGRRHTVKVTPSTVLLQVRRRRLRRLRRAVAAGGGGAAPGPLLRLALERCGGGAFRGGA